MTGISLSFAVLANLPLLVVQVLEHRGLIAVAYGIIGVAYGMAYGTAYGMVDGVWPMAYMADGVWPMAYSLVAVNGIGCLS